MCVCTLAPSIINRVNLNNLSMAVILLLRDKHRCIIKVNPTHVYQWKISQSHKNMQLDIYFH